MVIVSGTSCGSAGVAGVPVVGDGPAESSGVTSASAPAMTSASYPVTPPAETSSALSTPPVETSRTHVVAYPFDGPPMVDGTWVISWADAMTSADDYVTVIPDDGQGHWQYRHRRSGCLIDFWQLRDSSAPADQGERALSDRLIAEVSGVDVSAVSAKAADDALFAMVPGGSQTFQTRSVYGVDRTADMSVLYEARFFSGAQVGVAVGLRCPAGVDLSDSSTIPILADVALAIVKG